MQSAEELRVEAALNEQARDESWQRSDTDGFLSQWALGINAQKLRLQADIQEKGGSEFTGLYEGDRRVAAQLKHGDYGLYWLLADDEANKFGRRFIPWSHKNSRVQKQLGLCQRREVAPAFAKIVGSGTGLSGCASASVQAVRSGDPWGQDSRLIDDLTEND